MLLWQYFLQPGKTDATLMNTRLYHVRNWQYTICLFIFLNPKRIMTRRAWMQHTQTQTMTLHYEQCLHSYSPLSSSVDVIAHCRRGNRQERQQRPQCARFAPTVRETPPSGHNTKQVINRHLIRLMLRSLNRRQYLDTQANCCAYYNMHLHYKL